MIDSMTAFGSSEADSYSIIIKSVNGRGLDLRFRWPRELLKLESKVLEKVKSISKRGSIDVFLVEKKGTSERTIDQFLAFCKSHGFQTPSYRDFLSFTQENSNQAYDLKEVEKTFSDALKKWKLSREEEGKKIHLYLSDLSKSLKVKAALLATAPDKMSKELQTKLDQWMKELNTKVVDPARLAQEYALLKERHDIDEELSRLSMALSMFEETLNSKEAPHGKKLEFTIQELHREITTLGNKIFGVDYSQTIVEAKTIIDQMKEQVMNVE